MLASAPGIAPAGLLGLTPVTSTRNVILPADGSDALVILKATSRNYSAGGSPKLTGVRGRQVLRVDNFGNVGLGENILLPDWEPSGYHLSVPDFFFSNLSLRTFMRNLSMGEINDPCDITLRRFNGNYPYGYQADDTGTFTSGSNQITGCALASSRWIGGGIKSDNLPTGLTVTGVSGTTVTLSGNATASGSASLTINNYGTVADLRGLNINTAIGQVRSAPAICPFGGDHNTPGTVGAKVTSATIGFTAAELIRDLTGNNDNACGTKITFNTCRIGRDTAETNWTFTADGNTQLGLGATNAGDTGELVQIKGFIGQNEKQTISASGTVTGGNFTLTHYGSGLAPPGDTTGSIVASAGQWTAGQIQTALEALPSIGAGQLTAAGGPLPGTPVSIEFTGSAVKNSNFTRMGLTASLTGSSSPKLTVSKETNGIPSSAAQTLVLIKGNASPKTAPYLDIRDSTNASLVSVPGTGGLTIASKNIAATGTTLGIGGKEFVYTDDARLSGQSDVARRKIALTAQGLITETSRSNQINATTTPVSSGSDGTIYATLLEDGLLTTDTITNIVLIVGTAGSGTPPSLFKVALLDATGTVVATSSNLASSSSLTTTGKQNFPLSTPYTPSGNAAYYTALLKVGSFSGTAVQLGARTSATSQATLALGSNSRSAGVWANRTDLPSIGSGVTLSSTGTIFWMGVS